MYNIKNKTRQKKNSNIVKKIWYGLEVRTLWKPNIFLPWQWSLILLKIVFFPNFFLQLFFVCLFGLLISNKFWIFKYIPNSWLKICVQGPDLKDLITHTWCIKCLKMEVQSPYLVWSGRTCPSNLGVLYYQARRCFRMEDALTLIFWKSETSRGIKKLYWFSKLGGRGSKIKPATPILILTFKWP